MRPDVAIPPQLQAEPNITGEQSCVTRKERTMNIAIEYCTS